MYNKFMWIYIIPIIMISPILSISLNSWFSIWISLELNLMTFIPLIIFTNKYYKELTLKYYIIQSMSSSMLLFSLNFLMMNLNNNENNLLMMMNILINLSLLIKIGASPFHSWYINMMNNLNWMNCLILSTWQKIIPLILLMYSFNKMIIYPSIILSSIKGSMMAINHQSLRLIMSYSSINHMSWLLMNLMISEYMLLTYLLMYTILNTTIMLFFMKFNLFYINQINLMNLKMYKFFLLFNFISISGLPPTMGFMMKWFSMFIINKNLNLFILLIMIMLSLLTFYFYMKLCISLMLMFKMEMKIIMNNKMFNNNNKNLHYLKFLLLSSFFHLWIMNIWIF